MLNLSFMLYPCTSPSTSFSLSSSFPCFLDFCKCYSIEARPRCASCKYIVTTRHGFCSNFILPLMTWCYDTQMLHYSYVWNITVWIESQTQCLSGRSQNNVSLISDSCTWHLLVLKEESITPSKSIDSQANKRCVSCCLLYLNLLSVSSPMQLRLWSWHHILCLPHNGVGAIKLAFTV